MTDMMQTGTIIKIISNQYTIESHGETFVAVPRGKMRLKMSPVVGDFVEFEQVDDSYRIHRILTRKNRLLRPAIANVDQALIVTSLKDPDFSEHLLNRLIILISLAGVTPVICITKADICENFDECENILDKYKKSGYTVIYSYPGCDDGPLKSVLDSKVSVLCGQSGAGKSSLLNRLDPNFKLQTQEISKALGRGKHTTRFCELHKLCNGWVADTPGFSSLDFSRMDLNHLDAYIPDFKPYIGQCRFSDCKHINEPDCAIKKSVEFGIINGSMYEDYKNILTKEGKQ